MAAAAAPACVPVKIRTQTDGNELTFHSRNNIIKLSERTAYDCWFGQFSVYNQVLRTPVI